MTTTLEPGAAPGTTEPTDRRWAVAGVVAGLAGIASVAASMNTGAVYEADIAGDALAITERLAEMTGVIIAFHVATMVSALLVVVFAAGLHRDLARRLPGSALPMVAFSGLLLVAVAQLLGTALTTEFVFGVQDPDLVVPETAVLFGHWIGTVPWLWGTAGLTALSLGMATRTAGYPRWLGLLGHGAGGLLLLIAVSPLQYMAGMVGPVWLTVTAIGLHVSRRER